eukprot:3421348-Alexandrium_andersonii.AAC.1
MGEGGAQVDLCLLLASDLAPAADSSAEVLVGDSSSPRTTTPRGVNAGADEPSNRGSQNILNDI